MTSLPITNSTAQPAATKSSTGASESSDAQSSQPFGDVLAHQIKDPASKDVKANEKPGTEILAQLIANSGIGKKDSAAVKKDTKDTADTKTATPSATDTSTNLSTDMLAALLPQAMNTSAAAPAKSGDSTSANIASTAQKPNIVGVAQGDIK